jgi:hypothetical protein
VTIQIDSRSRIEGVSALALRNLLRRLGGDRSFTPKWFEAKGYGRKQSSNIVHGLIAMGYIKEAPDRAGTMWYQLTDLGHRFVAGSAAQRIHRSTAEKALAELMQRVAEVNASPDFIKRVGEVVVYGSYLSSKERLGDLDIAISTHWKSLTGSSAEFHNTLQEHFRKSGRQSQGLLDYYWPELQIRLYLKNRKRSISLHEMDDLIYMPKDASFQYRVLLGDAEAIRLRLEEAESKRAAAVRESLS